MLPRTRGALALACVAAAAAAWAKQRWRVARPEAYVRISKAWPPFRVLDWNLWVNLQGLQSPLSSLPFTPTLPCEPSVSVLMDHFDWQVVPVDYFDRRLGCSRIENLPWRKLDLAHDPRTVWVVPHALDRLLELAEQHFNTSRADRTVVFYGTEMPMAAAFGVSEAARNSTITKLKRYFTRILYLVKDVPNEHVQVAPMGLSFGYMLTLMHEIEELFPTQLHRRSEYFLDTMRNATRVDMSWKTRTALATASKVASWLDDPQTYSKSVQRLKDNPGEQLSDTKTNSSVRTILRAWEIRMKLRRWARTPAAAAAGVEFRSLPTIEWWKQLGKYRFLLNPMGSAIQTAKTYEALLVLTVPIICHQGFDFVFRELMALGFPLVLLDGWVEISRERMEEWWERLSPRLESFRRNCLTAGGYWAMYTGRISHCS